ncbi:hypothetical protein [Dyella amyloliquefaciens]|uniref:hypothetical protein n=1 Tax=Dyella amyloliquefaciens TaxID=1770545 RepID=UPI00102E64DA|nr:hypothetical protein [Dyella amyloliquefaciens]
MLEIPRYDRVTGAYADFVTVGASASRAAAAMPGSGFKPDVSSPMNDRLADAGDLVGIFVQPEATGGRKSNQENCVVGQVA